MTKLQDILDLAGLDAEKLIDYVGDNKTDVWSINDSLANRKIKDLKIIESKVSEAILLCADPLVSHTYEDQLVSLERAVKIQINQIQSTPKKKSKNKNDSDRQKLTQDQLLILFSELKDARAFHKRTNFTDIGRSISEVTDLDPEKTRQRSADWALFADDSNNKKAVLDVLQEIIDKLK